MRKKTLKCIADEIFWLVLSFLPVIGYLIYLLAFGQNPLYTENTSLSVSILNFGSFMSLSGLHVQSGNLFYSVFNSIFGNGGIMPLLSPYLITFLSYFCSVQLMHLLVDVLLFIVRIAHKYMNKATQGD